MALPSAVRKKAEAARQQVAGSTGLQPASTPRSGGDGYVDVSTMSQQSTAAPNVQALPPAVLANGQKAIEQMVNPGDSGAQAPGDDGGYIPHALAGMGERGRGLSFDADTGADSAALPANAGTDRLNGQGQSPDFIDPNDWQARYTALRSSRDSRVESLERELSKLRSTNDELTARLGKLSEKPAAPSFELDAETRERIGPDQAKMFDLMKQSVDQRIGSVEQRRAQEEAQASDRFASNLASLVPRWREMNRDPNFLSWLDARDPATGVWRQTLLDGLVADGDAESVAALFRSFAVASGHAQQRNGQPLSPEVSGARAGSGSGSEEGLVEVWSRDEIADFYSRKNELYRAGKLKPGTHAYTAVMAEEQKIRKAMEDGRVDP